MAQIVLNRANFIREMTAGKFDEYIIYVEGKEHYIVARCADGTELVLGTIGYDRRTWSNIVPPADFLRECGVLSFHVQYLKASS
ncbi:MULTISPECIES: hypothetical protein [Citrobacter]|uniref:hypothetical protein n=1 Tax=Citrobacter TaxID=544 RepID=UPI001BD0FB06|nr:MULTISPECIES: hypothetical protein [Citrobacter]MCK2155639.1 hypothetical protein [Citrobacter braakii]HBM9260396.1 hypothetical protein [Citrobacter freundii]